ncbi:hypothetical protein Q3V23_00245 [Streptomyces sp. VNUA116]|uniref:hypothetical protein n=1 Tax=Streptomyces sp. VNUA116 TaxID=3062449 RepID=UPI002676E0B4|nr:hypothetical protein [Streptomyces sp. VNUA116]WKU42627.1 hypothetical protein Q3V23_00245 [Streptomyces sp. VNUA116]
MIVMHDVGLVFIRTRKTAGTSVEIALSRHAGEDDVITSLSLRDEALRAREGGRPPQNHLRSGLTPGDTPVPPGAGDGVRFYNHMLAVQVRAELGAQTWEQYLTVCLERSPYEKVISLYFHRHRTEPRTPLDAFISSGEFRDALNWPLYTDAGGRILVDVIIRHEQLQAGLDDVCRRLALPPLNLPRAKAHFRPPGTTYRDILTPRARRAVEEAYAAEFEHHGYTW